MANALYLDCSNGASGDMIVAALLDAGASEDRLRAVLDSLSVAGEFDVRISRSAKSALDVCDFDVILHGVDNRDHDMAYLHGHGHDHDHGHEGAHHDHEGAHHAHHHHAHRGLAEVSAVIDSAAMADGARALAHRAFDILAAAEAKAHGVTVDEVHFHEVGAVDSIVDIICAAVCLDDLAPARVFATPLPDGHGTVRCQHGIIPVPVPAVVNICSQQGLPFQHVDVEGELVTPTGAALIAAFGARFTLPASYRIERVGLGAGKRDYAVPSLVRAVLIDEDVPTRAGEAPVAPAADPRAAESCVCKLECDIDDATSESLAYAAERLMAEGAREVHWLPIFTKKGRPAYQLQVIAAPEDAGRLESVIFAETTTIGLRRQRMGRTVLPREEGEVETPYGVICIKTVTLPDGSRRSKPEYEDVAEAARAAGKPFNEVARDIAACLGASA